MKFLGIFVLVLTFVNFSLQEKTNNKCDSALPKIYHANHSQSEIPDISDLKGNLCTELLKEQIKNELSASLTYLMMGAHFTSDQYYRPGVAAFFLSSANEERQHAKDIIEYILMRGDSVDLPQIPEIKPTWTGKNISDALNAALETEKSVRNNFREIIKACESNDENKDNDYHAADLMTGKFLEEQHESIRQIGGHLANLLKMKTAYGDFAEIIFDRTLTQE